MFRKTGENEMQQVMNIIKDAQEFLRKNGVDQWQNGYPNEETIFSDMKLGYSYVMIENDQIAGTVALSFDGESTYDTIYEGKWLSDQPYGVVHRFAVGEDFRGSKIATQIFQEVERICIHKGIKSIKIDTHEENKAMQRFLTKQNYHYCGIIHLRDGNKRVAFEKIVEEA